MSNKETKSKKAEEIDTILIDHFKVLGSEIRIDILKLLKEQKRPLNFSEIQKFIPILINDNSKFTYHLNKLREEHFILGNDDGYLLTPYGEKILNQVLLFEDVILTKNKIYVRTSNYKLTIFDERLIAKKLTEEANMPLKLANEIAIEAKRRLLKADITYLTAPLIREYINAILIENQLEDYRHKLTRLGIPPYDIRKLVGSDLIGQPQRLNDEIGNRTLEQFSLLSLLSQKFADNLLSGLYTVSDLKSFGINPLEIIFSGKNLVKMLNMYHLSLIKHKSRMNRLDSKNIDENSDDILIFSLKFQDFLWLFKSFVEFLKKFFTCGISIILFDDFLEPFLEHYNQENLYFFFFHGFCSSNIIPITIGIDLDTNFNYINPLLKLYHESLESSIEKWSLLPVLQIHLSKNKVKEIHRITTLNNLKEQYQYLFPLLFNHQVNIDKYSKWGEPNAVQIFTNLHVPIEFNSIDEVYPTLLIEKISLNLLTIFNEANRSNHDFFVDLEKAILSIFDYFDKKCLLLSKNLINFSQWSKMKSIIFSENRNQTPFYNWKGMENYNSPFNLKCAISFHGLDELTKIKSGFYIKAQQQNRKFTVKIVDFIYTLLSKQNSILPPQIQYVLCESHFQPELITENAAIQEISAIDDSQLIKWFRFGFHSSLKPLSFNHFEHIYSEISASKFKNFSLFLVPMFDKDLDHDHREISMYKLEMVQTLLKLNICCLSFAQSYQVDPSEGRIFKNIYYIRYLNRYFLPNWANWTDRDTILFLSENILAEDNKGL
jgi:ribonucleoside-triphosphate reductase (formate)